MSDVITHIVIGDKSFTMDELAAANEELRSAIEDAHRDFNDETSPFFQDEKHRSAVVLAANRKFQLLVGDGVLCLEIDRESAVTISSESHIGGVLLTRLRRWFSRNR